MSDDDDRFLYGDSNDDEVPKPTITTSVPQPIPLEHVEALATSNGIVANLEAKAADDSSANGVDNSQDGEANDTPSAEEGAGGGEEAEEGEEEEEEDESDDDVEIIMEAPNRSLDFRQRPQQPRQSASFNTPTRPAQQPAPSLTTEYTPRERGSVAKTPAQPSTPSATAPLPSSSTPVPTSATEQKPSAFTDGVDPSTLPVATAPPSHPHIDPDVPGTLDGRSVLEVDLSALQDKGWRRPGSDLSDWFNYGFDEVSWEAYCYRRRDLGELANVLKANVLNFAGIPEDQLAALPPEVRQMVMASASAMLGGGNGNPGAAAMMQGGMNMNGMMNPMMNMGPMMNPMMEMGGVDMGMGGQGMGMGMGGGMGNEGMGGQVMGGQGMGGQGMGGQGMGGPGMGGQGMGGQGMGGQGMGGQGMGGPGMGGGMNGGGLSGGVVIGSGGPGQATGRATPDVPMNMGGEGFAVPTTQGMGMQGEFGMQGDMGQQMYGGAETNVAPVQATTPTRGGAVGHFRGRGMQNGGLRGVRGGAFAGRGRGIPVRPASPLPPNVPTGPRNKNKYKDIDNNSAPAVDGLDYGGGGGGGGAGGKERSTPPDHEDRSSSRKRRSSPGLDEGRGSKRR